MMRFWDCVTKFTLRHFQYFLLEVRGKVFRSRQAATTTYPIAKLSDDTAESEPSGVLHEDFYGVAFWGYGK
jgi:hypothetical protein